VFRGDVAKSVLTNIKEEDLFAFQGKAADLRESNATCSTSMRIRFGAGRKMVGFAGKTKPNGAARRSTRPSFDQIEALASRALLQAIETLESGQQF
jgi:hypothetical protein